ncbi:MAG TPA: hypothetical protein VE992_02295 [Solirubrobacteraceae bacterium]|nr:hypothetical protein [Solirubrobacteraceae bacterium]
MQAHVMDAERAAALAERDAALRRLRAAQSERDAAVQSARAATDERDRLVPASPAPAAPLPPTVAPGFPAVQPNVGWARRGAAAGALFAIALIVALLAHLL